MLIFLYVTESHPYIAAVQSNNMAANTTCDVYYIVACRPVARQRQQNKTTRQQPLLGNRL
jgi:precorrin-6x reductase